MYINLFVPIVSVLLFVLAIMWSNKLYFNLVVKICLIGLAVWGLLITLHLHGWLVRI